MNVAAELIYAIDQWLVLALLFGLLLAVEEAGYRLGQRRSAQYDDDGRSNYGNLMAGLYGLMALFLAFTFAMAQQRFETRKDLVVAEANAIGTAWLRGDLVAEPLRGEFRQLLARYAEIRTPVETFDRAGLRAAIAESESIHTEIWARAVAAAKANPSPTTALLVAATNDVIDMHGKRVAAARNTVPGIVMMMVIAFALATAAVTGYRCGIGARRYRLPSAAFLLLVAMVIGVIIDLDRPQRGFITVDQSAMFDLRAGMRPAR